MAMSYADYKTFVQASLWRTNDTVLSSNLDTIIKLAEYELRSKTHDWNRRQKTVSIAPETQDFDLTTNVSDLETVLSVTNNNQSGYYSRDVTKTFTVVTPARIYEIRARHPDQYLPYYAVDNDGGTRFVRFAAPFSASDPGDLELVYRVSVPDYAASGASWLEDEYGDLFLYTILKHAAVFVRDDERLQIYGGLQQDAFNMADEDDKHSKAFSGSPLYMRPHHRVP
jgi:hypothetical protein